MELKEPWHAPRDPEALERQLLLEIPRGHVLHGVRVTAIAARQDQDDVLFALDDGSRRMAVVHLTHAVNTGTLWPLTELFSDLATWLAEGMEPDSAAFNA